MKPCGPIVLFVAEMNSSRASSEYDLMLLAAVAHFPESGGEPMDE